MARKRLPMRKLREVLRLKSSTELSVRQISACLGLPRSTVHDYIDRVKVSGLTAKQAYALSDSELSKRLFPKADGATNSVAIDFEWIHQELKKKGVTLKLLWLEYKESNQNGLMYSQFCVHYRRWKERCDLSMRQTHQAGERLFVDYAGQTVPVIDPKTSQTSQASIFVAVLGASNYTYAEASPDQSSRSWIASHQNALAYIGGVPQLVVPDNLKAGVVQADRYEPVLNRSYEELASHYRFAVLPARVRRPKDKAKVEVGVQLVERWILACLRHETFFSIEELNRRIRTLLDRLNDRPFSKINGTRRSHFEAYEKNALRPLPSKQYEFAQWSQQKLAKDYHILIDHHHYSVPHKYVGDQVEMRLTDSAVEIYANQNRIAAHIRSYEAGGNTTQRAHMPANHREYARWDHDSLMDWASNVGWATRAWMQALFDRYPQVQLAIRSAVGLTRLAHQYESSRLEAACLRAVHVGGIRLSSVRSILDSGLDRQPLPKEDIKLVPIKHTNIRGSAYFGTNDDKEERC